MTRNGGPGRLKIGILVTLFFLTVYGLVALDARQSVEQGPPRRTTYSAASRGYKALYIWLKELGVPIMRWEKALKDLPLETSVLLIVTPEIGPDREELGFLENWVNNGGTLVLLVDGPSIFLEHFGLSAGVTPGKYPMEDKARKLLVQPSPYVREVRSILSDGHFDLRTDAPEVVFHVRDAMGGLLAVMNRGSGRLIVLSDAGLFCNKSLRKGDHSRLALNLLLTDQREGKLLVDEYHHGYGRARSVLDHLWRSRAKEPMLQGLLLALILWAAMGRRFGPARPPLDEERRSSLAYFKAMAHLFQRAQARRLAFETVARWIQDEAKKFQVDKDGSFQSSLKAAKQRFQGGEISDRDLLMQVRGLYNALDEARKRAPGEWI
jgi:hypothetical protein